MSLKRSPPFRAEHLGSLLRTQELLDARDGKSTDRDEAQVKAVEDKSIQDIVDIQLAAGFHGVTDGEYRRNLFWGTFFDGLEGFEEVPFDREILRTYMPNVSALLQAGWVPGGSLLCTGKIKHSKSTHLDEFNFLKNHLASKNLPTNEIKLTIPSPASYHQRYKDGKAYAEGVYDSDQAYFADLAKVYQEELKLLYDAGLRNVQIDDPTLSYFCSKEMLKGWDEDSSNKKTAEELFESYITFYNDCFSQVPSDMHIGIHICRGNFTDDRLVSAGGYEKIAVRLFQDLKVDTFYLEFDTERAGGFEPLKHLPKNKNLILGVVSTKTTQPEDVEAMKQRVHAAAKFIAEGNDQTVEEALKRLGVSPQCGFASHSHENRLSRDQMVAKLKLVRQVADEIWTAEP
ncbi:hypothetical protein BP6252_13757 [Coleophoma cylindrospora]|uniref:Cobalamin-independent methionine synthase MetE C-terminal/archaeal domain-containing protein n=1 Tax=Coleophoma cylindrospora TaxID=1849047 RepID=A0A3D8Q735_9HELO|nr:hypothetical protein BP6252_13757 [Coleophoma cylindrospora]